MFLLKKLVASWLLPPLGFLLLTLVALLFCGRRRTGVAFACIAVMLAIALSLPIVSEWLSQQSPVTPLITVAAMKQAQAIVVLGGGVHYGAPEYGGDTVSKYSLERIRYGAKLARESRQPILVTGGSVYGGQPEGDLMKQVLEKEFAVPVRWAEIHSRNTAENALYSSSLLKNAGIRHIALVTHAWHMQRATAEFERYGLKVIQAPMGFAPHGTSLFESLLPSTAAFERSSFVIREWVGRLLLAANSKNPLTAEP